MPIYSLINWKRIKQFIINNTNIFEFVIIVKRQQIIKIFNWSN